MYSSNQDGLVINSLESPLGLLGITRSPFALITTVTNVVSNLGAISSY